VVSRAFSVLSDADKRKQYDKFGHDPDSRFGASASASASSPFSNFARRSAGGPGPGASFFEEEISPEEMFRQFFGGGMGGFGPFGGFDTGPQFVFNVGGGGPGIRVHQFGGGRPRRRPQDPNAPPPTPAQSLSSILTSLLPLILLFILPLLSSLFSTPEPTGPSISLESRPPHVKPHISTRLGLQYFVNPTEVRQYGRKDWAKLDTAAENHYVHTLNVACDLEHQRKQQAIAQAQGWFLQDDEKMAVARNLKLPSCGKLDDLRAGKKVSSGSAKVVKS
jgi:DnaJ homolog subfamily B member 12